MHNRLFQILIMCTLACAGSACEKPVSKTKREVMEERLEERIARWEQRVEETCLEKIMEEAVLIVDSTLLANAKLKRDTSDIPMIPERPQRPDFRDPADTTAVRPLLNDPRRDTSGQ